MNTFNIISNKFHSGVRWSFAGSIIYESIKAVHNFFLFSLMDNTTYGLLGSTFSIIYFSSKLADLGATSSLPPFFSTITQNKQTFIHTLIKHYLLPHIPLVLVTAIGATIIYAHNFTTGIPTILIPIIITLEAIRYFLRLFLHAAFKSKAIVVIEVALFINFIALIWIPHLLLHTPISLTAILIPHAIDSFLCVVIFLIVLVKFYKKLPHAPVPEKTILGESHLPANALLGGLLRGPAIHSHEGRRMERPSLINIKRLTTTKLTTYALRMSRDIFTSNFLTPLLALKCGLGQAGIFYFTTVIVNAIQSIIKMSIHYPASGLLSHLKDGTPVNKKAAFSMLCQKLTKLITPLIIFLLINYPLFLNRSNTFAITILFISIIESFLMLYEQFYILEEASTRLFFFKLLEFLLFYFFVIKNPSSSIVTLIATVACIKLLSFALTTLNAFTRWRLTPTIKPNIPTICFFIIASILFRFFYN